MRLKTQSGDVIFRSFVWLFAAIVVALAVALGLGLYLDSRLAWSRFGPVFAVTSVWDPVEEVFGALPFIYGTLVSSTLALLIAVPLGLGSAVFLAEFAPKRIAGAFAFCIEILAAVPSVVLGLMGIFVLLPVVRAVEPFLDRYLGFIPLFKGAPYGVGMLPAGIILALMVLPYIISISREALSAVPWSLKEGVLALGATRWEMVRIVSLPYARSGILGSVFLALGRALGETMAVTMVIGNAPKISASLLDPAYSMAAVIANELAEATSDLHVHALVAIGFVLFMVTLVVNALARLLIQQLSSERRGV